MFLNLQAIIECNVLYSCSVWLNAVQIAVTYKKFFNTGCRQSSPLQHLSEEHRKIAIFPVDSSVPSTQRCGGNLPIGGGLQKSTSLIFSVLEMGGSLWASRIPSLNFQTFEWWPIHTYIHINILSMFSIDLGTSTHLQTLTESLTLTICAKLQPTRDIDPHSTCKN